MAQIKKVTPVTEFKKGDRIVFNYYVRDDRGNMGRLQPIYATIIKVNQITVNVTTKTGDEYKVGKNAAVLIDTLF